MKTEPSPNGPAGDIVRASKTLTTNQEVVLKALSYAGGDFCFVSFSYLSNATMLTRKDVRRVTRQLARKGLAEYQKGLFTECGEVAGSGYAVTTMGRVVAQLIQE